MAELRSFDVKLWRFAGPLREPATEDASRAAIARRIVERPAKASIAGPIDRNTNKPAPEMRAKTTPRTTNAAIISCT